jgi:hypothetical protein
VAKALVEFETIWHQAWLMGIPQQRGGLNAPLLVQAPDTGKLHVNLDKELMQLIKCVGAVAVGRWLVARVVQPCAYACC